MKKTQEYITYLTPEFIYVPYDDINLLKIKKDKKVFNNSLLGTTKDGKNIFSPVSGSVVGIRKSSYNGYESDSLVIENDFIDKRVKLNPTKNVTRIKKSEIIESLEKYGLNKKINSKTTLVVNSLYNKNYDLKDVVINVESYEEILEAIDEFMEIFNMKTCYLCIDSNDLYSINAYEKYINAFLNICIVHSNKKFKDSKCEFYSIEEILAIYRAIHLDYLYDNTIITIYNGETTVVKVKIYSELKELLNALKIPFRSKSIYVNDKKIDNLSSFVIDSSVRSVVIKDN